MTPEERAAASKKRVEAARRLTPNDFSVWKHYEDRAVLSPTCEVILEAETTVDAVTGRFGGTQTQSTCEGTAVGKVTAVRR